MCKQHKLVIVFMLAANPSCLQERFQVHIAVSLQFISESGSEGV